jgi:hypothetical protein
LRSIPAALLGICLAAQAIAEDVTISATDTTQSVVAAQKNKRVTLRMRSGQELTGTVREVSAKLIVLAALSGREFFDAVIPLESVEAVIIRTKQ